MPNRLKAKEAQKPSEGTIRIVIPAWAEKAEAATLARGGYTDILHAVTMAYVARARARSEGAHRLTTCKAIMKKARAALRRARDPKRRVSAREKAAEHAGDLFDEACRRAKQTRKFAPLADLRSLLLPRGWSVGVTLIRQYSVANRDWIRCRVEMNADDASGVPFFGPDDLACLVVELPHPRPGRVPGPRLRRSLVAVARGLRRLGYVSGDARRGSAASVRFMRPIASASEINEAAAELDLLLGPKRKAVGSGSMQRSRPASGGAKA